jgi:hypothetical protein
MGHGEALKAALQLQLLQAADSAGATEARDGWPAVIARRVSDLVVRGYCRPTTATRCAESTAAGTPDAGTRALLPLEELLAGNARMVRHP